MTPPAGEADAENSEASALRNSAGWLKRLDFVRSSPVAASPPVGRRLGVSISMSGISKRLGSQAVLHDVSLEIAAGEFFTLLGSSGSGKTTLLMTVAGFVSPDRGSVSLNGRDITLQPPHRRDIGIVFQNYALFPHMSVARNIAYPLSARHVPASEIARRVESALALVRLPGFGERSIDSLSGGQRQRVAVARAVVFHPRVLLMDEPLSALDKPLREAMQIELRRLHADLGVTTIYVTHDQREALTLSDRIAVMRSGGIEQIGSPQDLYNRPRSIFVAQFLGESAFLDVQIRPSGVFLGELPIAVRDRPAGRKHRLLVRPERLQRLTPGDNVPSEMIRFSGLVRDVIFQGDSYRTEINLDDGSSIAMRTPLSSREAASAPERGERIEVGLLPSDATLLSCDD